MSALGAAFGIFLAVMVRVLGLMVLVKAGAFVTPVVMEIGPKLGLVGVSRPKNPCQGLLFLGSLVG